MPFLDESGAPLRVIHLAQTPATGRYFQLTQAIGFRESTASETYWAPVHVPADNPAAGNRTDLASVPWFLWGFVASYGRQSAPAILHDHRRSVTNHLGAPDAFTQAAEDDRVFRVGLRQQKVPLLRAWLMWTYVSAERYLSYSRWRGVLLLLQAALGVATIWAAVILGSHSPPWLLLLTLPALVAPTWGRGYALMLWLSYASAALLPLMLLQLCALVPYWLAELLVRETIDRPFVDPDPGPVAVPFVRAP